MNYELAKQLKDAVSIKTCKECQTSYVGGNKAFRCKQCQKEVRLLMNKSWQKRYYEKNKTILIERQVARQIFRYKTDPIYRENNLTKGHNRRAKIEGNGGNHTTKEWLNLVKEHNNRCVNCRQEKKLTRDHIRPISKGGTNEIINIQPLCASCNSSKKDKYEPRT